MPRENPYNRLKRIARQHIARMERPNTVGMFDIKTAPEKSFDLCGVLERVRAADQLGYKVELRAGEGGTLRVVYVKKPPVLPWELRP